MIHENNRTNFWRCKGWPVIKLSVVYCSGSKTGEVQHQTPDFIEGTINSTISWIWALRLDRLYIYTYVLCTGTALTSLRKSGCEMNMLFGGDQAVVEGLLVLPFSIMRWPFILFSLTRDIGETTLDSTGSILTPSVIARKVLLWF